jgi:hypothetical protein
VNPVMTVIGVKFALTEAASGAAIATTIVVIHTLARMGGASTSKSPAGTFHVPRGVL